jgi:GH24 family phage-related lysozyme (muramidase)
MLNSAMSTRNVAALEDVRDAEGNVVQEGALTVYSRLKNEAPAVLKGMSEDEHGKFAYLKTLVEAGGSMKDSLEIVNTKFEEINQPQRDANRSKYVAKTDAGGELRQSVESDVLDHLAGTFDQFVLDADNASPQLRDSIQRLGEFFYSVHGDKDATVEAITGFLSTAGETDFPVEDVTGFNKTLMLRTPAKEAGWNTAEEKANGLAQFRSEWGPVAGANGADPGSIFIAEDSQTSRRGVATTWPVFGVTPNGTTVSLGRYKVSSPEKLKQHKLRATYSKSLTNQNNVNKVRAKLGLAPQPDTVDKGGKPIPSVVRDKAQAQLSAATKRALDELPPDTKIPSFLGSRFETVGELEEGFFDGPTLPDMAAMAILQTSKTAKGVKVMLQDMNAAVSKTFNEVVAPKFYEFLNNWIPEGAAEGQSEKDLQLDYPKLAQAYGKVAANEPEQAQEMFVESQMKFSEEDIEVDSDDLSAINVTGTSQAEIADKRIDRLMEDNRRFLPGRPESARTVRNNMMSQAALELAHQTMTSPEQIMPHVMAMDYLKTVPVAERTEKEAKYAEEAALREEKFGRDVAPENLSGPRLVAIQSQSELGHDIYKSESFRALRYDDGVGKTTIGIGWNIHPGDNDSANQATVNWINNVNVKNGGKQYSLSALQDGVQVIDFGDAVKVMNRHVQIANDEMAKSIGDTALSNANDSQEAVMTDMVFQLGVTSFKKFKNMRNAVRSGDMGKAAMEMLDSTAFKKQTPMRFAKHFVKWVNEGTFSPQERAKLKTDAIAFTKRHKVKNVSNNNKVSDVVTILNRIR